MRSVEPVSLTPELIRAARTRERAAFDKVGDWISDELLDFYRERGFDQDGGSELRQRAALDLVEKFDRAPDDPELFRDWVRGFALIAVKKHHNLEFRHERKRAAAHTYPRTPARRPDSQLAAQELLARVRSELLKLRSPYRSTFMAQFEHDDAIEIAEELDVPVGTVRRRFWEVRRALKSALARGRRTSRRHRT